MGGKPDGVSSLQLTVVEQEEEMREETGEMQPLAKYIHIKDDSMKDLEVQLVDPKDMPDTTRLTQFYFFRKSYLGRVSKSRNSRKTKTTVTTNAGRVGE